MEPSTAAVEYVSLEGMVLDGTWRQWVDEKLLG